jgi:hypothetical protein
MKTAYEILNACRADPIVTENSRGDGTKIVFDYEKLYAAVDELVVHRDNSSDVLKRLKLVIDTLEILSRAGPPPGRTDHE